MGADGIGVLESVKLMVGVKGMPTQGNARVAQDTKEEGANSLESAEYLWGRRPRVVSRRTFKKFSRNSYSRGADTIDSMPPLEKDNGLVVPANPCHPDHAESP